MPAPNAPSCIPVDDLFASMLPDGGLRRGHVIGSTGPAAMSLTMALTARAMTTGSWVAVVGIPEFGVEAAIELGVPAARLVVVEVMGGPDEWAERVAAAADGFEIVVTRPPVRAERQIRKVRTRLQVRGVVMIAVGSNTSCDIEFATTAVEWRGVGNGFGHLLARSVTVRAGGRRIPRPIDRDVWLPGPSGRLEAVEPADEHADEHVTFERAG